MVVAGFEPLKFTTPALEHWLRRLDLDGVTLSAIDTGACVLAEAGLLDGHRLTLHWEAIDAFKESYPQLTVTQELFEIDRRRITCAGGTASIDLMLDLIAQAHGPDLAIRCPSNSYSGASARAKTTSACRSPRATASTTRSWCR